MAIWARKFFGTFEKRAPVLLFTKCGEVEWDRSGQSTICKKCNALATGLR